MCLISWVAGILIIFIDLLGISGETGNDYGVHVRGTDASKITSSFLQHVSSNDTTYLNLSTSGRSTKDYSLEKNTAGILMPSSSAQDIGSRCAVSVLSMLPRWSLLSSPPVVRLTTFRQIHHGIYECVTEDGIRFAFKTECRPAAKWHGQQGWPEIFAHHFDRLFFGEVKKAERGQIIGTGVPCARGTIVHLTDKQKNEVHHDKCGLRDSFNVPAHDSAFLAAVTDRIGTVLTPLLGVALEWQERHSDSALPDRDRMRRWLDPAEESQDEDLQEDFAQISDIIVLDFLLENDDRENKNWFFTTENDGQHRRIAMDNGWAFAGFKYSEDICSNESQNLVCPPVLRYATKSSECQIKTNEKRNKAQQQHLKFCRFRRRTAERVVMFARHDERWETLAAQMEFFLERDPLFATLANFYRVSRSRPKWGKTALNTALWRVAPSSGVCSGEVAPDEGRSAPAKLLAKMLLSGVRRRLRTAATYIAQCQQDFLANKVLET